MADPSLWVYLTGPVLLERNGVLLDRSSLRGRQARAALVYLVLARTRPVPRSELIEALWPDGAPPAVDTALNAVVSKLRGALSAVGVAGSDVLLNRNGCYELHLEPGAKVDLEVAANRLDHAEGSLRNGDVRAAWSGATVAAAILVRPLLPGDDAPWLTSRRDDMRNLLVRAYSCLVDVWLQTGDTTLAVQTARRALALAPFRESGYRRLMHAHVASGDLAEALRTYEECRLLLREELGVNPSAETQAAYRALLD